MGAGKTSVGRELSKKLRMDFYDLDSEVERTQGLSVTEIFEAGGEESFRQKETEVLATLSQKTTPAVISTGGGAVLRRQNRDIMSASGEIFYLKADVDTLWNRVRRKKGRPLLDVEDPRAEFQELFMKRKDIYERLPHAVSTDNMSVSEVADRIVGMLK
jgi:shikimate kinase